MDFLFPLPVPSSSHCTKYAIITILEPEANYYPIGKNEKYPRSFIAMDFFLRRETHATVHRMVYL
jgi:hypothetical protein